MDLLAALLALCGVVLLPVGAIAGSTYTLAAGGVLLVLGIGLAVASILQSMPEPER